ncbi:XRE family transcriptional regulator [Carnobacterium divergens]|uniref:XRE family transcriptional regulator n=1 Tax=Carnobacterium divergens TaxID=2748 RepID=UPI0039AF07A1
MNREEFLKSLIESKYKSVKAFSEVINIPYTTIRSILERGVGRAGVDTIISICKGLNISPEQLTEDFKTNEDVANTLSTMYSLDNPRQKKVYTYAERQLQEQNKEDKIVQFPTKEEDVELVCGHQSAAGFAILGDDSNMTSTVMKASEVPNGANEIVEITGNSMEPLIMKGEQVFIRHQPSVENGEIAIVSIIDDGITCKKVYYDDAEGTVTLESVNDEYEDMVFPVEDIRIIGKVLGK